MDNTTTSSSPESIYRVGDLVIDRQRHKVTLSNHPVKLSPTEFFILAYLAQKSPQVVSPQELMRSLYGYESDPQSASAVIRNNIYRIRSKLGEVSDGNALIRTVRGIGYRLRNPRESEDANKGIIDGRYHLQQLIGQGATAKVFKAYQENLDRHVAIKILRSSLLEKETSQERFRLEARHVGRLQHPNIVQVFDFGIYKGDYYIVMELIEGKTLEKIFHEELIEQQRMPVPQVLKIIREIGRALAYAHKREMIHRDVKPGNVMITADGRIMLMDFGLAKFVGAPHITADGKISGTPYYMAPEQIQGQPLDTRLDIYALGVVMYQLLTGRLPFIADNEITVLFQHIRDTPPLPSRFTPDLSEGLEYITLKALAKKPSDRYQSIEEMLADLDNPESLAGQVTKILPLLEAPSLPPHYLPATSTPFIHREEEVKAVYDRLTQAGTRLLTLVGIGGVGKTRLALAVGRNLLATFPDGVFFLDLTVVQQPSLLPGMIAHLINMAEEGGEMVKPQLLSYLSRRQLLLIMDNFEHILEAAPLVSEILAAAPQCKVLATSREPLRLYGEHLIEVAPLPLPDLNQQMAYEELSHYAAIQLFTDRVRAVAADFVLTPENIQIIARLCVQLDGLPLAIELAAGQSYAFSLQELEALLVDRLAFLTDGPRDRSARQQTMRGAIDWSYDLMTDTEKKAFTRLSIFVGRFSSEAAAEIIGPVNLQGLVQKSLLQHEKVQDDQSRFWMLQVIREYAFEKLKTDRAFETLKQGHTRFYLELAKTAERHLISPDQKDWLARLKTEHDNYRAVLARCLEENHLESALKLAAILWRIWAVFSYLSEGSLWLETLLNRTSHIKNIDRAKALFGAGRLALFQQKLIPAGQMFNESFELYKDFQDKPGQANILNSLGEIAIHEADYERAGRLFHEALGLFQAAGDKTGKCQSLTHLGQLAFNQGWYEEAKDYLLQSLELGEAAGTPETIAIVLNGLGEIARMEQRHDEATAYYERSLAIYRQLNYGIGQAAMLHNLGQVKLAQEQFQEAASLFRQSLSLLTAMEEKLFIGWNLAGLAAALLNLGNVNHAVRLFSASQAIFDRYGGQLDSADQAVYDNYLTESKKELNEAAWQQAWLEGQAMPVENELLNVIALTPPGSP